MSSVEILDSDALCHAARDISRHIAGMAEELSHLQHAAGGASQTLVDRQLIQMRDQVTLLSAVISDLEKTRPAAV